MKYRSDTSLILQRKKSDIGRFNHTLLFQSCPDSAEDQSESRCELDSVELLSARCPAPDPYAAVVPWLEIVFTHRKKSMGKAIFGLGERKRNPTEYASLNKSVTTGDSFLTLSPTVDQCHCRESGTAKADD